MSRDSSKASTEPRPRTLAARPSLRVGALVVAKEKMKWKKGGTPMPVDKRGSAFKVSEGAFGAVAGMNPLRVNWGSNKIGVVRGDQIRLVTLDKKPSSLSGASTDCGSGGLPVGCDISTTTADSCSRLGDIDSVSSEPSTRTAVSLAGTELPVARKVKQEGFEVKHPVLIKKHYWDREAHVHSMQTVLCTGGLRRLFLHKFFKWCSPKHL